TSRRRTSWSGQAEVDATGSPPRCRRGAAPSGAHHASRRGGLAKRICAPRENLSGKAGPARTFGVAPPHHGLERVPLQGARLSKLQFLPHKPEAPVTNAPCPAPVLAACAAATACRSLVGPAILLAPQLAWADRAPGRGRAGATSARRRGRTGRSIHAPFAVP